MAVPGLYWIDRVNIILRKLKGNAIVKVNFYATFRPIVGGKTLVLDLPPGSTIDQFLQTLFRIHPALRPELLSGTGEIHRYVHIFVNGRDIHYLPEGRQTLLKEGDMLDIFPPVGGGSA